MGSKIGTEKIMREDGYLYFVGKDGYVWRVPMKHNKRGSKKKVGTQKVDKKKGHLYYVGDDGYVYQAKMKNA
jgi:outer membrane protein assembly factor BamB